MKARMSRRSLKREMDELRALVDKLETETLLSGENDERNAIVTIHPGRWRHRVAGLGRDAHAHVPALGRAPGLLNPAVRISAGRRGGHQVGDLRRQRRARLRAADQRDRRASPGAHLALRSGQASPHFVRQRVCVAGNRREHRDRYQAGRHSHRHLSFRRQGRTARQHHGFCGAHHAHSDRTSWPPARTSARSTRTARRR